MAAEGALRSAGVSLAHMGSMASHSGSSGDEQPLLYLNPSVSSMASGMPVVVARPMSRQVQTEYAEPERPVDRPGPTGIDEIMGCLKVGAWEASTWHEMGGASRIPCVWAVPGAIVSGGMCGCTTHAPAACTCGRCMSRGLQAQQRPATAAALGTLCLQSLEPRITQSLSCSSLLARLTPPLPADLCVLPCMRPPGRPPARPQVRASMLALGACERVKRIARWHPLDIVRSPVVGELVAIISDDPSTPLAGMAMSALATVALVPEGRQAITMQGGAEPLIRCGGPSPSGWWWWGGQVDHTGRP